MPDNNGPLSVMTFRKYTGDEVKTLTITAGPIAWTFGLDDRLQNIELAHLNQPAPLDYLKSIKQALPELFTVHAHQKLLIDCEHDLEQAVMLLTNARPSFKGTWKAVSTSFREFAEDYGLPCDREVKVNDAYWMILESGSVVPPELFLQWDVPEIFSVGWTETGSMTSGWDSFNLFQISDDIGYIKMTDSDDTWDITPVEMSSAPSAVIALLDQADSRWDMFTVNKALRRIAVDFLSLGIETETYWGLNPLARESAPEAHDCDLDCFPASPTAAFTFKQRLTAEDRQAILHNIKI